MPSGDVTAGGTAGVAGDDHISTGSKWFTCALSGTNFPIHRVVRQRGLFVADIYADAPSRQEDRDPRGVEFSERDNPYGV